MNPLPLVLLIFAFVLFVLAVTDFVADVTNKVRCIGAGLAFWVLVQFVGLLK